MLVRFICRKFDVALDVGCGRGHIARHILEDTVGVLYQCDMAERVLVSTVLVTTFLLHAVTAQTNNQESFCRPYLPLYRTFCLEFSEQLHCR